MKKRVQGPSFSDFPMVSCKVPGLKSGSPLTPKTVLYLSYSECLKCHSAMRALSPCGPFPGPFALRDHPRTLRQKPYTPGVWPTYLVKLVPPQLSWRGKGCLMINQSRSDKPRWTCPSETCLLVRRCQDRAWQKLFWKPHLGLTLGSATFFCVTLSQWVQDS